MGQSQNIFDYATSELSQDAFISLLVAWFNSKEKELQEISKNFINSLYNEYYNSEIVLEITSIIKIKPQHFKIDVYFEVEDKNIGTIPFIIEDKTWTEPHSNQLNEYVKKIVKAKSKSKNEKKFDADKIVKIYFKTGHITEKDLSDTTGAKYKILDCHWIYNFLISYKNNINNATYIDYLDYLERNFYLKLYNMSNGKKRTLDDWKVKDTKYVLDLQKDPQYAIYLKTHPQYPIDLKEDIQFKIDLKEGFNQYAIIEEIKKNIKTQKENYICYTKNGKIWNTWWTFYEKKEQYKLFIKIVKIEKVYKIRLIEYTTNPKITPNDKKKSLTENIDICKNILGNDTIIEYCKKANYQIKSGKTKGKLVKESEIASLSLENKFSILDNTKLFYEFLKLFLERKQV